MSVITARVVNYAAQECYWQQSGEMSVAWMIKGWHNAHRHRSKAIAVGDIIKLGMIVEPRHNRLPDFRSVDVRVGADIKMPHGFVHGAIERLVDRTPALEEITEQDATDWFCQYEDIHT